MKSLRVHFFNRHGIDLDNPGPGAPSSLLLALEQQNAAHLLPALTSMTALAAYNGDSADSVRSNENVTPPMHFLTPHVEISMADNDGGHSNHHNSNNNNNGLNNPSDAHSSNTISSGGLDIQAIVRPTNGCSPASPNSADSNSNVPSSSHSLMQSVVTNSRHMMYENSITPSISLIPIKQVSVSNSIWAILRQNNDSTSPIFEAAKSWQI
jgi:IKAROS family zinc finger protein